jgi:cytoskeletal protein CcmA (bactofilin family)
MFFKIPVAEIAHALPIYLAAESIVHGQIKSEGDVDVAGHFVGTIIADRLTVLSGGCVNGDVTVQTLHIEGSYVGRAEAGVVRLGAQSNVKGELTYRELAVPSGAKLNAQCRSQGQFRMHDLKVVTSVDSAAR